MEAYLLVQRSEFEESLGGLEDLKELLFIDFAEPINILLLIVEHHALFENDLRYERDGVLCSHLGTSDNLNNQIIVELILFKGASKDSIRIVKVVEHLVCVQNIR